MKEDKEEAIKDQTEVTEQEEVANEEVNEAGQSEEADEETGQDEAEKLKAQIDEAKDKYLRLYSEFENFRRRTSKEKLELISTASREVIEALLPVLDDFERSIKAEANEAETEGVKLIYNKFKNVLESKGLKKMEIEPGTDFDDDYHEAITQIPAPTEDLAGKIVDVVEPGYFMGDKVIRFAKVVTGAKQ